MRLFEYQAKSILKREGLNLPRAVLLNEISDISFAVDKIGLPFVLKAQTLSGGRGKAGGIKVVQTKKEAEKWYKEKLGTLINGKKIESILAEEWVEIESEYYLSFTVDTDKMKMLFSTKGGIHVETEAAELFTCEIEPEYGLEKFSVIEILSRTNIPKARWPHLLTIINKLYSVFLQFDCLLLEINPLVCTRDNEMQILDVHLYLDNNAIQRQEEAKKAVLDMPEIYPQSWHKINYGFDLVILDPQGTVGLLTTGAGLTMATIDELISRDIQPINFSDVRSGQLKGDPTRLVVMLEKLTAHKNLRCIFVSIFAGITDLAEFASMLLNARNQVVLSKKVDWVIRLEGNNFSKAKSMLEQEGLFVTNSLESSLQQIQKEGVIH